MGDRFYTQMLNKLGQCPGHNGRKKRMAWTDEQKQEVIDAYLAANPTAENSTEIVAEIAEDTGQSVNGVRMILVKADVYVKKVPGTKAAAGAKSGTGGGRVSKAAAAEALTAAITDAGQEADEDIISKLTGKAAVYFTELLKAVTK